MPPPPPPLSSEMDKNWMSGEGWFFDLVLVPGVAAFETLIGGWSPHMGCIHRKCVPGSKVEHHLVIYLAPVTGFGCLRGSKMDEMGGWGPIWAPPPFPKMDPGGQGRGPLSTPSNCYHNCYHNCLYRIPRTFLHLVYMPQPLRL